MLFTVCVELLMSQMFDNLLKNTVGGILDCQFLSTVWKETHACSING